jgi:hypothetical protein
MRLRAGNNKIPQITKALAYAKPAARDARCHIAARWDKLARAFLAGALFAATPICGLN